MNSAWNRDEYLDRRYLKRKPRSMRARVAGGLAYVPALAGLCAVVLVLAPVGGAVVVHTAALDRQGDVTARGLAR
jgi:hypothetical protein